MLLISSERLRQALGQPVARIAWLVVLLVGACIVAIAISTYLMELDAPKSSALPPHPSAAFADGQALILGNSQFRGIDPRLLSVPTVNRALPGSDYSIQFALLKAIVPKMPQLRILLLGFDNVPLHTPGMQRRNGDYSDVIELGVPWHQLPELSVIERLTYGVSYSRVMRPLLVGPKLSYERLHEMLVPKAWAKDVEDSDPTQVREGYSVAPADGLKKIQSYMRWAENSSHSEVNREAFLSIVRYCSDHGIHLVLLRTPTTQGFWKNRSGEWNEELNGLLREAQTFARNNQIVLWDSETNNSYSIDLFKDPNHLTNEGYRIYSEELSRQIDVLRDETS